MEKSVGATLIQFTKGLAIAFPAGRIRGGEPRLEKLLGCERQLIAQFGLTLSPGAAHIKACALTETACQLSVDVGRKPAIDATGCQRIRGTHHVDHHLDEASFVRAERQIAGHWRRQLGGDSTRASIHGLGGGWFGCFRERRGSYQDTRSQRSSARGSGSAEKASTIRMEGFIALVIGHRSCSPLFIA